MDVCLESLIKQALVDTSSKLIWHVKKHLKNLILVLERAYFRRHVHAQCKMYLIDNFECFFIHF